VKQVNLLNELAADRARSDGGQGSGVHRPDAPSGFEYSGMILHESYFSSLRPGADAHPPGGSGLSVALAESFGSVAQWQAAFQPSARRFGETRGVGWVILFQDPGTGWLTITVSRYTRPLRDESCMGRVRYSH
jgi:superoxide dismutase